MFTPSECITSTFFIDFVVDSLLPILATFVNSIFEFAALRTVVPDDAKISIPKKTRKTRKFSF
jgi:hypothetical protein